MAELSSNHALLYNLMSGLSVVLGGITISAVEVKSFSVGMLLAFGAGQYIYIAAVELLPMGSVHQHGQVLHTTDLAAVAAAAEKAEQQKKQEQRQKHQQAGVDEETQAECTGGITAAPTDAARRPIAINEASPAATQGVPYAHAPAELSLRTRVISLLLFIGAAVSVGVVLLNHDHCDTHDDGDTGSSSDSGDGHNH